MTKAEWDDIYSASKKVIARLSIGRSMYDFEDRAKDLASLYFISSARRIKKGKPPIDSPIGWMMYAGREFINRRAIDLQATEYDLAEYAKKTDGRSLPLPFSVENIGKHTPLVQLYVALVVEERASADMVERKLRKLFRKTTIRCTPNVLSPRHGVSDVQWIKDSFDLVGAELKDVEIDVYQWGVRTKDTNPEEYGCYQNKIKGEKYAY